MTDSTLTDRTSFSFREPPPDFDPTNADNETLLEYGLPPRPSDPEHRRQFDAMFYARFKDYKRIVPELRQVPSKRRRQIQDDAATPTSSNSSNWCGAWVVPDSGCSMAVVQGTWTIPTLETPAPADVDGLYPACSIWVGLDGWHGTSDVCQAGVTVSQPNSEQKNFAWYEWFPGDYTTSSNSCTIIENFPVNANDVVTFCIFTEGNGSTSATAFGINRTNLAYFCQNFQSNFPEGLTGNCAEWVIESFSNLVTLSTSPSTQEWVQAPLPNYGSVTFSECFSEEYTGSVYSQVSVANANTIELQIDSTTLSTCTVSTNDGTTTIVCNYVSSS